MKKLQNILILTALLVAASCTKQPMATIEGVITEANEKTLYLDFLGVTKASVCDSAKLDANGSFRFQVPAPECFDFYRLRIGKEMIYLSVDSTETLRVDAALPTMSIAYNVEGSEDNLMLKKLVHKQSELQSNVLKVSRNAGAEIGTASLSTHWWQTTRKRCAWSTYTPTPVSPMLILLCSSAWAEYTSLTPTSPATISAALLP